MYCISGINVSLCLPYQWCLVCCHLQVLETASWSPTTYRINIQTLIEVYLIFLDIYNCQINAPMKITMFDISPEVWLQGPAVHLTVLLLILQFHGVC